MGLLDSLAMASRGFAESLEKGKRTTALDSVQTFAPATEGPAAMFADPYAVLNNLGYKGKASPITYGTMDAMMRRVPLMTSIIQTRLAEASLFTTRPRDRFDSGLRIVTEEGAERMSAADKKRARELEVWLLGCGVGDRQRPGYAAFKNMCLRDSLRYDQMTFEIVYNRKGLPAELWPVDAKTIRLADTKGAFYEDASQKLPHTVQVKDGMIVREFMRENLAFCIRNPHTDIELQGYGVSELEWLVSAITSFLFGFEYNSRFFSQGSTAKGLLHVKGFANEVQLNAFRRFWYQMVSGVENAWRTPVVNAEEVNWVNMHTSNRDMEFSAWMDFLIKNICAVCLIDPVQVGHKYGTEGQGKSMFEASGKEKVQSSKDKGLKPILDFWARSMNENVISKLEPGFLLEHSGLDAQDKKEDAQLTESLAKTTHTTNELRARDGLGKAPPVDGVEYGDIIMSPTVVQYIQAKAALKQQEDAAAQQGQDGDPLQPGDDGESDGNSPDFPSASKGDEAGDDEAEDAGPEASPELSLFEKAFPNTLIGEVLRKARPQAKERVLLDVIV